jgi:hypothetical protein
MKKSYKEPDKSFVIKCAEIDHAFHTGSHKKNFKPHKNTLSQEEIINAKYKLQPYVSLFSLNGSYLSFREEILTKDPQWWVDNDFPVLNKDRNYFYLIYRAPDGYMYWQEISKAQFLLLKAFKQGATLSEACGLLEDDEEYFLEAIDNIQYWFQNWSELNLLAIRKR